MSGALQRTCDSTGLSYEKQMQEEMQQLFKGSFRYTLAGKTEKSGGVARVTFLTGSTDGSSYVVKWPKTTKTQHIQSIAEEAMILEQIGAHDHIIQLEERLMIKGDLCLVLKNRGEELFECVNSSRGLPLDLTEKIARQILSALEHLERRDIIHRDIKPENILFDQGKATLIDFGMAHKAPASGEPVRGTLATLAPEQVVREMLSCAVDIWALAATLFSTYTGLMLFPVNTGRVDEQERRLMMHLHEKILGENYPPNWRRRVESMDLKMPWTFQSLFKHGLDRHGDTAEDVKDFQDMLLGMLKYDPEERLLPTEALSYIKDKKSSTF